MTQADPLRAGALPDPGPLLGCVPRLRRYARVLRRNPADADDLVQDTLERAWSRAGLWPGVSCMRSWLFSIMHNLHVDDLRRGRLQMVELEILLPESCAPTAWGEVLDVRALQRAFEGLPPDQQQALDLVVVQGLSYVEAACRLDVPVGTVMSRLARARERLRQRMDAALPVQARGGGNSRTPGPST